MLFLQYYNKILMLLFNVKYINQKIGIIAGNFRLPYKYDIDVVLELLEFCDKVIIVVSNNSKLSVLNRVISKTNLLSCSNLLYKIESTNKEVNKKILLIKSKALTITYNLLELILNLLVLNIDSKLVKDKIIKYINDINSRLLNSIKYFNLILLTGDYIKQIFLIMFLNKPVDIKLALLISPVIDTINIVNNLCKDCTVYLTALNNFNDRVNTWLGLMDKFANDNEIIEHYSKIKPSVRRLYILNNFDKLTDLRIFGNKLDKDNIIKIRNVLNG